MGALWSRTISWTQVRSSSSESPNKLVSVRGGMSSIRGTVLAILLGDWGPWVACCDRGHQEAWSGKEGSSFGFRSYRGHHAPVCGNRSLTAQRAGDAVRGQAPRQYGGLATARDRPASVSPPVLLGVVTSLSVRLKSLSQGNNQVRGRSWRGEDRVSVVQRN